MKEEEEEERGKLNNLALSLESESEAWHYIFLLSDGRRRTDVMGDIGIRMSFFPDVALFGCSSLEVLDRNR